MRFCFDNKKDAELFLERIRIKFDQFGYISLADVYRYFCPSSVYSEKNENHGWLDISQFKIDEDFKMMRDDTVTVWVPDPIQLFDRPDDKAGDPVNHPDHYKSETGLETIDVIEAFTDGLMGVEATDTGNVIKYICRWKKKNGLQDLKKAQWYLNHLINHVEKEN